MPDKVSKAAVKILAEEGFNADQKPGIDIKECSAHAKDSDAMIARSYELKELEFDGRLKAISRAGAGVNNIPVEKCTEKGIVVFNTPGANANAVKELVICGLLLSSRKIVDGVNWTVCQKEHGQEVPKLVEKGKNQFKGTEIKGKHLGVVGLGAIGMLVANDAVSLGMNVIGYDPYITIENAWRLSADVNKANSMDHLTRTSDYITFHIPLTPETRGSVNREMFSKMKKGVKIMNFSRDEIVNTKDLIDAIKAGIVERYVTDFPNCDLLGVENIICIPHLGASTEEAEENCAVMASGQIVDFLKTGSIKNSVNFPDCQLENKGNTRITVINRNVPAMIEKITTVFADNSLNIEEMLNKSRGNYAYNIFDVKGDVTEEVLKKLEQIEGVLKVRKL
jgi:D-3-phosphoglycerate dehydrogenase